MYGYKHFSSVRCTQYRRVRSKQLGDRAEWRMVLGASLEREPDIDVYHFSAKNTMTDEGFLSVPHETSTDYKITGHFSSKYNFQAFVTTQPVFGHLFLPPRVGHIPSVTLRLPSATNNALSGSRGALSRPGRSLCSSPHHHGPLSATDAADGLSKIYKLPIVTTGDAGRAAFWCAGRRDRRRSLYIGDPPLLYSYLCERRPGTGGACGAAGAAIQRASDQSPAPVGCRL